MYSDKKNVLQLAALLKEHEIRNVVLCPGSRNIPIVQTLARHPFFTCHAVTDERNAGFFGHRHIDVNRSCGCPGTTRRSVSAGGGVALQPPCQRGFVGGEPPR